MINTITISGFKSISELTLELGKVNCFIGANGVGKSNILEAIGILGAAANGVVDDEALSRRGVRPGLPRLYKSSFEDLRTPAHIGLSATQGDGAEYRISILNPLENPNPAWEFKTEHLSDAGNVPILSDGVRNKKNLNPTRGLAAYQSVELDTNNSAFRLIQRLQNYSIYCPNTPALRGIVSDLQSREPLGLSGGRLAEAFSQFKKEASDEALESILELIDWVEDIDTTANVSELLSPSVSRSKLVVKFTDRFMRHKRNMVTAYDASEGALYILFCAVLCMSANSPLFLAIDNIDQALNPRLVTRLASRLSVWLQQASKRRQLLFTAHNPAVLDGLDLQDDSVRLFAVDRNSAGHTQVTRILMTEALAQLNAEYPLSRLWLMGRLGAVPNV